MLLKPLWVSLRNQTDPWQNWNGWRRIASYRPPDLLDYLAGPSTPSTSWLNAPASISSSTITPTAVPAR